ncbi:hypothetical protein BS47DRAFT_1356766 [Hydnum rufescens UP504]|uniref:Uncharacterized protein n=1 Tax=Hydnum rufescens UP504 TaxID=1448309 RepID=A0A9P6DL64_9AGAM|nr:hypothetical protein BS47DRAFT_1356766 [Hydnum rufescens UP504]
MCKFPYPVAVTLDTEMLRCMEKSIRHCIHSVAPAESLRDRKENNGVSSWEATAIPFFAQNKGGRETTGIIRILGAMTCVDEDVEGHVHHDIPPHM